MEDGADDTSCAAYRFSWDVFLSFRGVDTRKDFIAPLYDALVRHGVRVFRDDEGMERGDVVSPTLLAAIEDSAAAIAVISKNYANSKWCLDELATIFERRKLIIPVFYDVDPSDVRWQRGSFGADFRNHELEEVGQGKVERWRNAMNRAGNIPGLETRVRKEQSEIIEILVKRVLKELNNTRLGVAKYPVGLETRLKEPLERLDVQSSNVLIIGFSGIGGIGKTTLAKALFNKLAPHFKKRSFISNIREESRKPNGLGSLQGKLVANLNLGNHDETISDTREGMLRIKKITHNEPVLIVLDDVDSPNQLHALAGGRDWFYGGSRIIITSRDERSFQNYVDETYKVDKLTYDESVRLFSYHALGREKPTKDFTLITKDIVTRIGGVPLALEVFGSSLFYMKSKKEWVDPYEKLQKVQPDNLVQGILEISLESLHVEERRVFLDLACFFVSMKMKRDDVVDIFKGCGFNAETIVSELTGKSLVRVVDGNVLWMHDQLRDMGREIVRQEVDSGPRSRLWERGEILDVLKNEKGTRKVEGIILDFVKKHSSTSAVSDPIKPQPALFGIFEFLKKNKVRNKHNIGQGKENHDGEEDNDDETVLLTKSFKPMLHLRLLQINYAKLDGDFKLLPAELKWLQWKGCPLKTLPPEFRAQQDLAVLDLSESQICQLWKASPVGKMGKKLAVLNLYACRHLEEIPDLSGLSLEKLMLEQCSSLVTIHKSLGDMSKLTHLNLKECTNLVEFPSDVSGLKSLEKLFLSGCIKLRGLPEDMSGLKSLKEFLLDRTAITELPKSIFRLKNLEILNLDHCESLKLLPKSIGNLSSLKELSLSGSALQEIPEEIGQLKNLEKLNLGSCKSLYLLPPSIGDLKSLTELILDYAAIKEMPESISSLCNLKRLWMSHCVNLSHLPDSLCKLSSLVSLILGNTPVKAIPEKIGELSSLELLDISNCKSIRSLPDSIEKLSNLTEVVLNDLMIEKWPGSIGSLGQLTTLKLDNCKNLQRLPFSNSTNELKNLRYFYMAESAITELPVEIGTLTNLKILKMRKETNLEEVRARVQKDVLPYSFYNLSMLEELDFHGWRISGKISDDFGRLSRLQSIDFSYNSFTSLPSSLSRLSLLKILLLIHCEELKTLPPLPDNLLRLSVANCFKLELMHDVSNLTSLQELELTNCGKLVDIPGLEHLKLLRKLYTGGCEACLSSVQKRLSEMGKKLAVLNLYACRHLEEIPDLSGLSLEKLILEQCSSLVTIHKSLGDMSKLTHLNLKECTNLVEFPSDVSGLKSLEKLFLSGCIKLRGLPEDMSGLKSLKEFLLDHTAITELPKSIFRLKNLEILNLDHCESLKLLPKSIGNLSSLRELSLSGSALQEIPEEIGQLKNLEKLNLGSCKSLYLLPHSIGDLKSLTELILDYAAIKEMPESISSLCNLKRLWMSHCVNLSHLPDSICKLSSLVSLILGNTPVKAIPEKIGELSSLELLDISNCKSIRSLPDSIEKLSSLTEVVLNDLMIEKWPGSIGSLGQLTTLKLDNCKNLQRLPFSNSTNELKNLRYFYMAESAITELPVEIGTLTNLKILNMRKETNLEEAPRARVQKDILLPCSFYNLSMLEELDFHGWRISGKISDDFVRLSRLQGIDFSYNSFTSLPSSLSGLSMLKILMLIHCEELKTLPQLPDNLLRLSVANCFKLELMHDVSNLTSLQELELTNCGKLVDIPGLEHLKLLRKLYTGGCEACLSSVQKRLSEDTLRHISDLCVPGNEIPNWFVQEVPQFSWPKNRKLKGVIIALVVSLDQHAQDRDMVPAIVDNIEAKIKRGNEAILTTTLNLHGVPNTDQDQLYLCRYHDYDELVSTLEHGDNLQLTTLDKPCSFPIMTIKKHGLHLVFENDDDNDALCNDDESKH